MADDKVRSNVQSKFSHRNVSFLSSAIFLFVITNSIVFLAITIHQLRQIGDVGRMLQEKRLSIENFRLSCWNNNYVRKEKLLEVINQLPKIDDKYHKLKESVNKRQATSMVTLFQDLVHAQEQLLMQRCTPDTVICIKGQKGEFGFPGEKGDTGPVGSKGQAGATGIDGPDGSPGDKGVKGTPGDKGAQGPQNTSGAKGDTGIAGDKGAPGIVGIKGDSGLPGVNGSVGDKGQPGSKGLPGVSGSKGVKGQPGPKGDKGSKGVVGDVGAKGTTGNGTGCDCMDKPKFKEIQKTESVHYGNNVTLDCSTISIPEPTITWVKTDSDGCFANFSKTSGDKIELNNIQPVDVGTYRCTAENAVGTSVKTITVTSPDSPDVISCDFESGFCDWSQGKTDDADFSRNTGVRRTPTGDHTPGKGGQGYYVNIDSSAMTTGQTSELESYFIPAHEKHCLTFWYYVDGASGAVLKVKTKACSQDETTLLKLTRSGTGWKQSRVDIPVDIHGRQIIFEAERGNSASDVAIDDVTLSSKECPPADKKPEVLNKNQTIVVQKGDRAELPCNVTGLPSPSLTWEKVGTCITFHGTGQPLVLQNVQTSNAGTYKCIARNSIGQDEGEIKLIVNETETCTFDSAVTSACDWKNIASGDDLDWQRQTGSTPSSVTGPSADHTNPTNGGYYMYVEASSPADVNDTAVLQYKTLPSGQPFCLRFWYHMYGSSMGSLRVLAKDCVTQTKAQMWKMSGDKGNKWNQACLVVEQGGHDYNLQIEAVRGPSYHSDIGIDDVTLSTGQCPCDKPVNIVCDFEVDKCESENFTVRGGTAYQMPWVRTKGQTPSVGTGPDNDHTTGTGYYIFVETSGGSAGLKGSFLSPELPANQEACLHFWYNMNGVEMGDLDVIVEPKTGNGTNVFHQSGNKGTRWLEAKVTIPSQTQPYKIDFQATRGSGFKGDAALDDISIRNGPCV